MLGDLPGRPAGHGEERGRRPPGGPAVQRHVLHRLQPGEQPGEQGRLVLLDGGHRGQHPLPPGGGDEIRAVAERGEVLHRGDDPGQVGEGGGAALEPAGHARRRGRELVRMHAVEQGRLGDHGADVRAGPLVGAGGVEVGAERRDVHRHVRGGVHAVHVDQRTDRVRGRGDGGQVGPGADDVAGRRDRD